MIVLGLNQAHDAGAAVVEDGRPLALIQRERFSRRKRSALLTPEFIEFALARAGVSWADVDCVAMATCQSWPFLFLDPEAFSIHADASRSAEVRLPESLRDSIAAGIRWIRDNDANARDRFPVLVGEGGPYEEYISDDITRLSPERSVFANIDWPYQVRWWREPMARGDVAKWCRNLDHLRRTLQGYIPATATLRGVAKPALLVPHHLAHAANAFYQSDLDRAAIYTVDNGEGANSRRGYIGGIAAYGEGNRLLTLGPTFPIHGHLYQRVAEHLGLGAGSGAGKLMGLAPYGQPRFFDRTMVGNACEVFGAAYAFGDKRDRWAVMEPLVANVRRFATRIYDDPQAPSRHFAEGEKGADDLRLLGIDLAATAQKVFEENVLDWVRDLAAGLVAAKVPVDALCLGGGGALNCPTNSRILAEGPFRTVFVPPCCDDSGLPLGAALAVVHDVFDRPRETQGADRVDGAYLGQSYGTEAIDRAIRSAGPGLREVACGDPAEDAAAALERGEIVGWFEGRSEVGPRALGHRTLMADARHPEMWRRVNHAKRREYWRPFAPAVLEERAGDWFDGAPSPSPYMLFTARVRGGGLPAVTHVDGSARIQTVDRSAAGFRKVVEAFDRRTGTPVVMNTSLNGPGEPIVETPEDATRFLLGSPVAAVYVEGRKLVRSDGDAA